MNNNQTNRLKRSENTENMLYIYQLNCNSLSNKLAEIKYYLYRNKPDILCLCETMIKKYEPKFIGYNVLWKHRNGDKGGLAILIRQDISFREINFNPFPERSLELQIIEFADQLGTIRLGNMYNPHQNILVPEFNHYLNILGNRCILIGDFNAHSPLWDIRGRSNCTGKNIERILEYNNLEILNNIDLPTYIDNSTGRTSTLDLCIASSSIANRAEFGRGQDIGSDHFPVEISIGISVFKSEMKRATRWKLKKVEWAKWSENLCGVSEYILPTDTISHNQKLTDKILRASNSFIPKSKTEKSLKRCTPWWDQECKDAITNRNVAKNILIRHPLLGNLIEYKRCQAKVKVLIKKKKTESWRNFASTLQSNTPSSKIWRTIKAINGKQSPRNIPIGNYSSTDKDKANLLLEHLTLNVDQLQANEPLPQIPERTNDPFLDIKEHEIIKCISKLKNTCPGADDVCNIFFKKAPKCIISELLQLYNSSLISGTVPDEWKSGIICPIPKPGKDPTLVSSYRPITMLSCIGKLLERILKRRLEFFLETEKVFPATQTGFRKSRSTIDCLATLKHIITKSLSQKKYCLVTYLDLQSAYDCVWHDGLIYKLKSLHVNSYISNWLQNYLKHRKVKVRVGLHLSEEKLLNKGLPQGAVLSPVLFNIMLHDMPTSDRVKVLTYADDITLVCTCLDLNEAKEHMQQYLNTLTSWLIRWKFLLNPQKCSYQIFTKKRHIPDITLLIANQNIYNSTNQRVLGIIFDAPKLSFREHINYIKTECSRRLCVLRSISSNSWGASRNLLRRVYISYVRSKMEYGCVIFAELTTTLMKKLTVVQNNALRTILGARKTSPVLSLEVEAYVMPLDIRFKFLFIKWYCKMLYSPFNEQYPEIGQEVGLVTYNNKVSTNNVWASSTILDSIGLNNIRRVSTQYISPVPPNIDLSSRIKFDMFEDEDKISQNIIKKNIFMERKDKMYNNFIEIYTDGSKLEDGSTSAAMFVPHQSIATSWKLNPFHSVLGAELYAILKSLQFVATKPTLENHNIVLFTDSKSALHIIVNTFDPSYKNIAFQIQKLLYDLGERVKLQWVRGHIGVLGNETADRAANLGHSNSYSTLTDLSFNEVLKQIKEKCFRMWVRLWKERVTNTQRGDFMSEHIDQPVFRPWLSLNCRLYETVSARFRIGHFGLNSHMNRFEMRESPECEFCGANETIEHFLFECEQYNMNRNEMRSALDDINVDFVISNLMLGGDFSNRVQIKIHKIVIKYLVQSGTGRIRNF